MTPAERQLLLKLLYKVREMNRSEARCMCGRRYCLTFDAQFSNEIDVAEAIVNAAKVSWIEVD